MFDHSELHHSAVASFRNRFRHWILEQTQGAYRNTTESNRAAVASSSLGGYLPKVRAAVTVALLGAAVGCAGTPANPFFEAQPFGWTGLQWRTCPKDVPGATKASCAHLQVPLDWDMPSGRPISVFVRRFTPTNGPTRGQLWALDGGPGDPGDGFASGWFLETAVEAGFELIVPTHRGVAYGTALRCEGAEDLPSCLDALNGEWGDEIRHFDTHQAARDVVAFARAYPPSQGPILLFGGSYGSAWLQRVLELEPVLFQGAYVDSAAPLGVNFEELGTWTNDVGLSLLQLCADEPKCEEHFASGVLMAAERVQERAAVHGECLAQLGANWTTVQARLSALLELVSERALIAPILYRLDRCDATALEELQYWLSQTPLTASVPVSFNGLLNIITLHRENYRVTRPIGEVVARSSTHLFDSGGMIAMRKRHDLLLRKLGGNFPRPPSPAVDARAYAGPLHIVQGGLDPRTPPHFANEIVKQWPAATADVVIVKHGGHASPRFTRTGDADSPSCSEQWLRAFLQQPKARFNTDCLRSVLPLDLAGDHPTTTSAATKAFGVNSVWGQ